MDRAKQEPDIFGWLESLFPDWKISDDHQRFLNLICGWDGGIQTNTRMPLNGWNKIYNNWKNGNIKPKQVTLGWDCLPHE